MTSPLDAITHITTTTTAGTTPSEVNHPSADCHQPDGRVQLDGVKVAALGLTFKAGTDDLRDSPSLVIVNRLMSLGADVAAYDPTTAGELDAVTAARLARLTVCAGPFGAIEGADVAVVLTEWPEFAELDPVKMRAVMRGNAVVDTRNHLNRDAVRAAGLSYTGVGRR